MTQLPLLKTLTLDVLFIIADWSHIPYQSYWYLPLIDLFERIQPCF